jgi:hypothetical protein
MPNCVKTKGLIHYWSFNSHIQDVIGGAHLFNGSNAGLTNDRFGRPLSALNLNVGMYQMPKKNYFPNIDFTIISWVYLKSLSLYSRIVEFSDPLSSNGIFFMPIYQNNLPGYLIRNNFDSNIIFLKDTKQLPSNTWIHIGLVLKYPIASLYMNGTKVDSGTCNEIPANMTRSMNFIGRSSYYPQTDNPDLNAKVDELKIFNRALSTEEIMFEMMN